MAEYSRLAQGTVLSTGGETAVILPFIPDFVEVENITAIIAGAGVYSGQWQLAMGQGAAIINTANVQSYITAVTGTGIKTIKAGLALQYGPNFLLGGSGSITKNSTAPLITTTAVHGLVVGNVVVFNNLYETSSTGMQQIAGIPFVVETVPSTTSFTINWNTNQSDYTAIAAGGLNALAGFKKVLHPALYAPGVGIVSGITLGTSTIITTTAPTNVVVGQEVGFHIPTAWGTIQLNELPNVVIPGSPIYGYVTSVTNSVTFTVNINSTFFTAYNSNQPFASFPGQKFPYIVPVGDVNTGGLQISAGSQLYPSPQVYNGYSGSLTVPVNTINGPAILGAFFNATFQGFLIGSGVSGASGNTLLWRAYLNDYNS